MLETLREVSAKSMPALLQEARLDRLSSADLADGAPPAVRTSEVAKVYAAVYRRMGETLTRLFLSSYGHKMGPMLVASPAVQALMSKAKAVPERDRLAWSAREVSHLLNAI